MLEGPPTAEGGRAQKWQQPAVMPASGAHTDPHPRVLVPKRQCGPHWKGAPLTGSSVRGAGHGPGGWTGASQRRQGEPASPSQDEPAQPLLLPPISPGWGGGRSFPGPLEPSRGERTALRAPRPGLQGLIPGSFVKLQV